MTGWLLDTNVIAEVSGARPERRVENGLYLATRNVADVANSGAAVFNPWEDNALRFPL